jgi:transaldolase / glucose-6-phosphate isomerase
MATEKRGGEAANPLVQLRQYGQSVWLDFMRRSLITSGELKRLVEADGLAGLTSNPAIFQKAIEGNQDYVEPIAEIAKDVRLSPRQVFEKLAVRDIQDAADVLLPVYRQTGGADGYVSLEVAPDVATKTQASVEEGRRLWLEVSRPNLMIKIPATREGLPAILTLLQEGVNVNITLLFSRAMYERVAETFVEALEARAQRGDAVSGVASVASFFVSRIDSAVEAQIADRRGALPEAERSRLDALAGKVAIANAKLAYQSYKRIFSGPRWEALSARGARPQRVLWASTGTKNPEYSDVLYVDELIGPDTINTLPPETLSAFRDHGRPRLSLEENLDEAKRVLAELEQLGISLDGVTDALLIDGVKKFVEPYTKLLETVERRVREVTQKP